MKKLYITGVLSTLLCYGGDAIPASVLITEVMAKNGTTLRTETGVEGLDWVELYNSSDEDIDLSNWYMGNDPTKAPSKWKIIEGSCIIPSKGYKVVWFDGDGLCGEWATDEAHVAANLSTDAGKHTVFLASAADTEAIVQQVTLPAGIKDISYGQGHLSQTLVSSISSGEYKVGAGGWKSVSGPIGMSAVSGGFTFASYKINKQVSTMDVADACLLDPSTWSAAYTNNVQTLAFAGGGATGSFNIDLYSEFPGAAGNDIVCVATGTITIPEAGDWTFSVGSAAGFSAKLTRLDTSYSWESRGIRSYRQSTATFNLEEGAYEVEVRYFNRNGGHALDFSAAKGRIDFDETKFQLVGMGEVVHAGALGAQVAADVSTEMVGNSKTLDWKTTFMLDDAPKAEDVFRLLVKYADGFTAKVNGKTVASVPALGDRPAASALKAETFLVDASDIVQGVNILEITVENDVIEDTELYLSAELIRDMAENTFVYFTSPTPGAPNGGNGRTGLTPKVSFSEAHGWKDVPFDLSMSCPDNPDAIIYYTLDGTSPKIGEVTTMQYTGPIHIDRTTVLRAAVPDVDSILQMDSSATYLFYDDVIAQGATAPNGFPLDSSVNSQRMLYGLSTNVTLGDAETQERLRRGFTENTRTISLVIDPKNLFDGAIGIYVNATGNGRGWERQTLVEQINPMDSKDEFSVPAGLRIRGGGSRGAGYPKHSFRLFFRSEYGMGTLEHPLYGDEGANEFDKIDLRTSQNLSWANDDSRDTFVHECFSRDSERDMGKTYNRSRYYHLFINGIYWGLYQTEERVDQNYAKSYNGGAAENYDVVRTSQPGYNTGVVEGESAAWEALWRITTQEGYGEGHSENYRRVLGLNLDGTRNTEYPILLNVTNLIEFILSSHYAGDVDSPVNSSGMANNVIAFRNRIDGSGREDGFLWNRHDAERSLGFGNRYDNVESITYGTIEHDTSRDLFALGNFNPNLLHYELMTNALYRAVFADLVYKHMVKKGGVFTAPIAEARYRARMSEIDDAIVCESARWGHQYSTKRTRQTWLGRCSANISYMRNRLQFLIAEYQRRGWYPSVGTPTATDGSGIAVSDGDTITADDSIVLNGAGTVYYTLDGSDPRSVDLSVASGAIAYSDGISVPPEGAVITMRAFSNNEWSPVDTLTVKGEMPQADVKDGLRIAEVLTAALGGDDALDFLVLTNVLSGEISLEGVKIVAWNAKKNYESKPSLTYIFEAGASILPGASLRLSNLNKLTNSQVGLRIYASDGTLIQDVFLDSGWWNNACDETGAHFLAKTFGAVAKTHTDWMPTATMLGDKLRVLEMYTSTRDGGDSNEYIVLTNLDASAELDLTDVRVVAWNSKKKSELEPSLTIVLDGVSIAAGGWLTLDQATYFGGGKLTNSKVGLKIYDPAEVCAQEVEVNADWWEGACDGTGASFLAIDFSAVVKSSSQWTPKVPLVDWPENPSIEITEDTKPIDLGITSGAFTNAAPTELRKLAAWAKKEAVPFGGEAINAMTFDSEGNPETEFAKAYLLNCAVDEIEAKKDAFRFEVIVPGEVPSIDGDFNGKVNVFGSATLEGGGNWSRDQMDSARFFRATLSR